MTALADEPQSSSLCCANNDAKPKNNSAFKELEFAVNMTCQSCVDAVRRALDSRPSAEVKEVRIRLAEQRVLLQTTLHVDAVLELLESTGLRAVLQGAGTTSSGMAGLDFAAGVVQVESAGSGGGGGGARGVVRILQPDDAICLFDGTVDGLSPGREFSVEIRQGGDLSQGAESCGPVYRDDEEGDKEETIGPPSGLIGRALANSSGRVRFSLTSTRLCLWRLIGRCLSISDCESGAVCGLGVVARSAGIFTNEKRLCSCDGVEIWSERDVPAAGAGRAAAAAALKQQLA